MVNRIALGVEYCGTPFRGWQSQAQGGTVQDALEFALGEIAGQHVGVICAGRTDAGVHASHQVVHFDARVERPLSAWVRGVNSHLPDSVAVRWAQPVSEEFHARFSARGRQDAAGRLRGEHDFSAFRAAECQAKTPVKILSRAEVRQQGSLIILDFEASAFLHHMGRNLVGSLVRIGRRERSPGWVDELLLARDRRLAAPTFAADGLYFRGPLYEAHWSLPDPEDDFLGGALK